MTRRWLVPVAWAVTVVLAAAAGLWAARATLETPSIAETRDTPVLYTVAEGTVSRVMSFTAKAQWQSVPLARNAANGTVTTVDVQPGDRAEVGLRLYSVDLRPVTAAEGAIPAFRDLAADASGADVEQLQTFLAAAGHYGGAVSGAFDAATASAVRKWQKAIGIAADGVVRRGDLLFFPDLPARVTSADALQVGAPISAGETAIEALPEAPTFTITLGVEQADLVPLVTTVLVHHAGAGTWQGRIASSTTTPTGELILTLEGPDGTPLCGDQCAAVPIGEAALYTADLVAVPEKTGPVVPVSALRTRPDGSVTVVTEEGRVMEVKVLAAAEGRAVVSGIDVGTTIRLFGESTAGGAPSQSAASS